MISTGESTVESTIKDINDEIELLLAQPPEDYESSLNKILFRNYNQVFASVKDGNAIYDEIKKYGPRKVCQYQFKRNDIVWICKQCQKDETCVLCNDCFQKSNHTGHEVYFYHSNAGGCCDCGDGDAWAPEGFCCDHGRNDRDPLSFIPIEVRYVGEILFRNLANRIRDFCIEIAESYSSWTDSDSMIPSDPFKIKDVMILQQDDYHRIDQYVEAIGGFIRTVMLSKIMDNLRNTGSAIVTLDDVIEDYNSLTALRELAQSLNSDQYHAFLASRNYIKVEQDMIRIANWLYKLAQCNDGFCTLICTQFARPCLDDILSSDPLFSKAFATSFHNMLLNLMANYPFKMSVAVSYASTYSTVASLYGEAGQGLSDNSLYTISVQYLNRISFVSEISLYHDFMESACFALWNVLQNSIRSSNELGLDFISNKIISHRRYYPIIGDLKIIFTIPGMSHLFLALCGKEWLEILKTIQYMHPQQRRIAIYSDSEAKDWMNAFNLYIGISSVFEGQLNWLDGRVADCKAALAEADLKGETDEIIKYALSGESNVLSSSENRKEKFNHAVSLLPTARKILDLTYQNLMQWQQYYVQTENCRQQTVNRMRSSFLNENESLGSPTRESFLSQELKVFDIGPSRSFHIPLHRFFASILVECYKHDNLLSCLAEFSSSVTRDIQLTLLVDMPLSALIFASEIRLGMWKRNGLEMNDQLLNYSDTPFCRCSRDLDLVLLQFAASLDDDGANRLIIQILHRLQLLQLLCPHPFFSSSMLTGFYDFNDESSVLNALRDSRGEFNVVDEAAIHISSQTSEAYPGRFEEALILFINLISELPLASESSKPSSYPTMSERSMIMLRRELIHRLAAGPSTYSQLQACVSLIPDGSKISQQDTDKLIMSLSEVRPQVGLEAPKRVLKPECWKEYDPVYPRMRVSSHQHAVETMPKPTAPVAAVEPPYPCHSSFLNYRINFLSSPMLLHCVRMVLLISVAQLHGMKVEGDETNTIAQSYKMLGIWITQHKASTALKSECRGGGSLLSRVVHILTLIIHVLNDDDERLPMRDKIYLCKTSFASFLMEELHVPVQVTNASDETSETSRMDSEMKIQFTPLPRVLRVLYDLQESFANNSSEVCHYYWLKWLLDQCSRISQQCHDFVQQCNHDKELAIKAKEMELRKKRARNRVMNAMQASAKAFASMITEDDNDNDEDLDYDSTPTKPANGVVNEKKRHMSPTCIICQQSYSSAPGNSIGYISFSQCSKVMGNSLSVQSLHVDGGVLSRQNSMDLPMERTDGIVMGTSDSDSTTNTTMILSQATVDNHFKITSSDINKRFSRLHIRLCGHAMHYSCFEAYIASENRKAEIRNGMFLDVSRKEFYCPLCKRVSNFLTPYCENDLNDRMEHQAPPDPIAWMNWFPSIGDLSKPVRDAQNQTTSLTPTPELATTMICDEPSAISPPRELLSEDSNMSLEVQEEELRHDDKWRRINFLSELCFPWKYYGNNMKGPEGVKNELETFECVDGVSSAIVHTAIVSILDLQEDLIHSFFQDIEQSSGHQDMSEHPFLKNQINSFERKLDEECRDFKNLEIFLDGYACALKPLNMSQIVVNYQSTQLLLGCTIKQIPPLNLVESLCDPYSVLRSDETEAFLLNLQSNALSTMMLSKEVCKTDMKIFVWTPLLTKPLLQLLITHSAATRGLEINREDATDPMTNLLYFGRWLCVVSLVQGTIAELVQDHNETIEGEDMQKDAGNMPLFVDVIHTLHNRITMIPQFQQRAKSSPTSTQKNRILSKWLGWLRVFYHLMRLSFSTEELRGSASPIDPVHTDKSLISFVMIMLEKLGLNSLIATAVSAQSYQSKLMDKIICWTNDVMTDDLKWLRLVCAQAVHGFPPAQYDSADSRKLFNQIGQEIWTGFSIPQLLPIPSSYTQFHAVVTSVCSYEYPGVCLACGAVMDAAGHGYCTQHVRKCSRDGGIIFLLQDHRLLLCYGHRGCYFPAPFVDDYGECNSNFRGKPLHLDDKRYRIIQKLWFSHGVATEVVHKRSNSARVIINGYY